MTISLDAENSFDNKNKRVPRTARFLNMFQF